MSKLNKNILWLLLWVAEMSVVAWIFSWLAVIDDPIVNLFWWIYVVAMIPIGIAITWTGIKEVTRESCEHFKWVKQKNGQWVRQSLCVYDDCPTHFTRMKCKYCGKHNV